MKVPNPSVVTSTALAETRRAKFARWLQKTRLEADGTQVALAEACKVTQPTVAQWEAGYWLPRAYLRAKIYAFFGKTAQEAYAEIEAIEL